MTSQEDLNKIHYVHADDTELYEELRQAGVLFQPDTTGRIYHVSRASGPANLAVMATIRQGQTTEITPIQSAVIDIQTL